MNKAQIKAELRRSACEDENLWMQLDDDAFEAMTEYYSRKECYSHWEEEQSRFFFLLVAEAL